MPFRGPGTVSLLTFELWYRSHVAVLADISQEATWGIYGCKSKFPKPHGGLTWPLLSWASRGCSRQCHESWALLAGWEAPSPRAPLKMLPVEQQAGDSVKGKRTSTKPSPPFSLDYHEVLTVNFCDSKVPRLWIDTLHWVELEPLPREGLRLSQGTWINPDVCSRGMEPKVDLVLPSMP